MKEVTVYNEAHLTIFKLVKEMNKWYGRQLADVPTFKAAPIKGLWTVWRPTANGIQILLDTDHRTYAVLEWTHKDGELFIQDVSFKISDVVVVPDEVKEEMLIAVVRIYEKVKEKLECIENQNC